MRYHPVPASRAQGPGDRAGGAAVADGRGRAHRRAEPARAARVPQHPGGARDRRQPARHASTCGCADRRRCSSRLQPGEIVAVLDLGTARAGSRLFHIRNDEVRAPFGVEVAQVVPSTLALELEKSARRDGAGRAGGRRRTGARVRHRPDRRRPGDGGDRRARVARAADPEATTEPVSVKDAKTRVRDVVTVGVADSAVRLAQPQNAQRHRRDLAGAGRARARRRAGALAQSRPPGCARSCRRSSSHVTVRGRRTRSPTLRGDSVHAFVDLAGLGPGRYNLRVQVDPSESFGVSRDRPGRRRSVTIK